MQYLSYTAIDGEETFQRLDTSKNGLSSKEVLKRLGTYGKNQTKSESVSWFQILLRQFKSPFSYLLIGAFGITLVLGEGIDSVMILLFVAINTILGFIQEYRSEKTVSLLNTYLEHKTKVIRDGKDLIIPSSEIVPGDIVLLEPGDIVPADIRVIESFNMSVDESILTGESAASYKSSQTLSNVKELYESKNICFGGTTILTGEGKGVVVATGKDSVYADIAKLTTGVTRESLFEKEIAKFSKFILWLVIATLGFVILANLILHKEVQLFELLFFSIALAVSVIPEALPVVTTFSLSIGASRLAKKHVVVKRLSAIEDLGGIEVLCSDKTGTLTENNLEIDEVRTIGNSPVLLYATLASEFSTKSRNSGNRAFEETLFSALSEKQKDLLTEYERVEEFPFDPERKRASSVIKHNDTLEIIVRGAPEEMLTLLEKNVSINKKELLQWISEKGKKGVRVLAVAKRQVKKDEIGDIEKLEKDLDLLGFIGFFDPIKKTTKEALINAKKLGVQVKIVTGDSPEVAGAVAFDTGLISSHEDVITGSSFEGLDMKGQHDAVKNYHVFARVTPSQKYKIIELLRENFQVGFLGEGINDAPALKSSNVGLVVHDASDIAREAADVVLLDKSLSVIIDGIREGRAVFANTNKYITATLSSNFGNFFAIAIVSLIIDFLPMLPLQILLVNLLSDFPMISIATDSVDHEEVETPNKYSIKNFAFISLLLGVVSTVFDFIFFAVFKNGSPQNLQTHWFIGSILTELIFIYSIRTRNVFWKAVRPPLTIIVLTLLGVILTIGIPFTSFGQSFFEFVSPTSSSILTILLIVCCYFITTETVKNMYYRYSISK